MREQLNTVCATIFGFTGADNRSPRHCRTLRGSDSGGYAFRPSVNCKARGLNPHPLVKHMTPYLPVPGKLDDAGVAHRKTRLEHTVQHG